MSVQNSQINGFAIPTPTQRLLLFAAQNTRMLPLVEAINAAFINPAAIQLWVPDGSGKFIPRTLVQDIVCADCYLLVTLGRGFYMVESFRLGIVPSWYVGRISSLQSLHSQIGPRLALTRITLERWGALPLELAASA